MLNEHFFWKMFELTGSITAYLVYRDLAFQIKSQNRNLV